MRKASFSFVFVLFLINFAFAVQDPGDGSADGATFTRPAEKFTLKSSIDIAMDKSPTVIAAKEGVAAADGKLGQVFGTLLPLLTLTGRAGSSYSQPYDMVVSGIGTFSVGTEEIATVSSYTFSLAQPVDVTGKLFANLDIAQSGFDISKQNLRKANFDLAHNVVSAYYGVLMAKKIQELSEESLDMARSHLAQVKAMFSAGTATKADVLRVEVQVANMEVGLTKAENALALAKDAFNNVLGRDLDSPIELSENDIVHELVKPKSYKDCLSGIFESNPDWLIFVLNKRISEKTADIAFRGYFPDFSLVGTSGNNTISYPDYEGGSNVNSWSVTANASWNLFDGLATQSRIKEANANLAAARANEEATRNGIILEVKDACLNLESAIEVIKSAKKAVESAKENYRISREKYRNGVGSNLEMIDAQTALKEARTNLYQAEFDYQIAKAKVNQSMGQEIYSF